MKNTVSIQKKDILHFYREYTRLADLFYRTENPIEISKQEWDGIYNLFEDLRFFTENPYYNAYQKAVKHKCKKY